MKVGIVTQFYNSKNYGGMLQAYALTTVLNKLNYDAEQICYEMDGHLNLSARSVKSLKGNVTTASVSGKRSRVSKLLLPLKELLSAVKNKIRKMMIIRNYIDPGKVKFLKFQNSVPHSDYSYNSDTIFMTNEIYDAFITGSDQVFNLNWHSPAFFLEFADKNKKKISYAASAGSSEFDDVQKKYLARALPKFDAVSVREKDLVDSYSEIAGITVTNVADPVLLLDKTDWDKVAADRLINEKYIFCLVYSPTKEIYDIVSKYSRQHNLKIAIVPYASGVTYSKLDDKFGDYRFKASPEEFISLIKYAEFIFTDSFHVSAFSLIYDKPFFAVQRDGHQSMGSRLYSLTELFDCKERFCDTEEKKTMEYLDSIVDTDYSKSQYEKLKKQSFEFLTESLG